MAKERAERLRDELRLERLLPNLASGLVIGVSEIVFAVSLGNLLFSGPLARYAPIGIGIALFTAALMMIGLTLGAWVK